MNLNMLERSKDDWRSVRDRQRVSLREAREKAKKMRASISGEASDEHERKLKHQELNIRLIRQSKSHTEKSMEKASESGAIVSLARAARRYQRLVNVPPPPKPEHKKRKTKQLEKLIRHTL